MTIKEYLKQAETNLQLMSRTAQGIIDTGTSLDKITKMSDGLTAEIAAKKHLAIIVGLFITLFKGARWKLLTQTASVN